VSANPCCRTSLGGFGLSGGGSEVEVGAHVDVEGAVGPVPGPQSSSSGTWSVLLTISTIAARRFSRVKYIRRNRRSAASVSSGCPSIASAIRLIPMFDPSANETSSLRRRAVSASVISREATESGRL
jgi:hypothetical protein